MNIKTKMKLSKLLKGRKKPPRTKEHRRKLGLCRKGVSPWNKGLIGYKAGKEHYNWKGGITPDNKLVRGKSEWRNWRKKVFERDNYTCQKCYSKSGRNYDRAVYLEPHHIFAIKDLIKYKLRKHIYNVDNGITLCNKCHKLTFRRI